MVTYALMRKTDESTAASVEEWQLAEVQLGIADLDAGYHVSHEEVSKWLQSWGTPEESEAPR